MMISTERTSTAVPALPRARLGPFPSLIFHRWNYLQQGITRIMLNLQDGVDLQTVCAPALSTFTAESLLTGHSIWAFTRSSRIAHTRGTDVHTICLVGQYTT